jgi:hypothetical protein
LLQGPLALVQNYPQGTLVGNAHSGGQQESKLAHAWEVLEGGDFAGGFDANISRKLRAGQLDRHLAAGFSIRPMPINLPGQAFETGWERNGFRGGRGQTERGRQHSDTVPALHRKL